MATPELGGELGFAGQLLAVGEQAERDGLSETARDDLGAPAVLQRRERRMPCGPRNRVAVHGPPLVLRTPPAWRLSLLSLRYGRVARAKRACDLNYGFIL